MQQRTFLLFIALAFGASSCTSVPKLVCKHWKVEEVNVNSKSSSLSAEQLRSIQYQLKNEFDFRFYPDSIYMVIKGYDTTYGNWYLSANKKQLISSVGGEEQTSEILKINKKEFTFHPLKDFGSINFIRCIPATTTK